LETLIATAALGLLCMVAELFGLRKAIIPMAVIGLLGIFGYNATLWDTNVSYYNHMFTFDNYAVAFSGLILLLTALILVLASDFYKSEPDNLSDYLSIFLFTISGSIVLVGYTNLAMLFIGIEILSISLYVLAGSKVRDLASNEAGMKYFLTGSFASGFLLFGIALVYGATGSFDLSIMAERLPQAIQSDHAPLVYAGLLMMLGGMFFKVSAAPFHFWAPDVYQGSPALITAFMATVAKLSAVAALYRLLSLGFVSIFPNFELVFAVIIVATIFVGNIMAAVQNNFKRLLAFSGISHAGYLLLCILCVNQDTDDTLLYYSVAYGIANITAFAISIPVFKSMESEDISSFNGLVRKKPLLAVMMTIALLSMASIPPLAGFWAKYKLFTDAIYGGYAWITVIGIINTLIGVYYYFKVIRAMLMEPAGERPIAIKAEYVAVAIITTIITIAIGILPSCLMDLL